MDSNKIYLLRFLSRLSSVFCKHVMLSLGDHFQVWKWVWKMTFFGRRTPIKNTWEYFPPRMLPKMSFSYDYYLTCSMCDRCRKGLGEEGKETMIGLRNKETLPFSFCFCFSLPLPSPSCACHTVRGKGGTSGILEWGCAAGALEPLVYTRASSREFCNPIRD